VTGYAIAMPVGAVAALIIALSARTSWAVGASAGLGAATVDGVYAAVAVIGGQLVASVLRPIQEVLDRWPSSGHRVRRGSVRCECELAGLRCQSRDWAGPLDLRTRGRRTTGIITAVVIAVLALRPLFT
jgi:hypothetical protein